MATAKEIWDSNETPEQFYNRGVNSLETKKDQIVSDATEGWDKTKANTNLLIEDLSNYELGADTAAITNAAADVARRFLESKLKEIQTGLTTFTPIEVRAIIKEVSPYVSDFSTAANALKERLSDIIADLNPNGGKFWKDLGEEFINFAANDPAVQETLANLNGVKIFADTLNMASDIIETVQKIFKVIEPIMPIIEIASKLAMVWMFPNTSSEIIQKWAVEEEKMIQQLITLLLGTVRKYVYSIKIPMPNLFVGVMQKLSVRDAVQKEWNNEWLTAIFSEEWYNDTVYDYTYGSNASGGDSWNKAIRDSLANHATLINDWSNLNFTDLDGNPLIKGDFMKSRFMNTVTDKFMKNAVQTARINAGIRRWEAEDFITPNSSNNETERVPANGTSSNNGSTSRKMTVAEMKAHLFQTNYSGLSSLSSTDSIILISGQLLGNT